MGAVRGARKATASALTATQERNARKRAAKKRASKAARELESRQDPSLRYIKDPLKAPLVVQAQRFFSECGVRKSLSVHVGPVSGWRTEAKLAVRKSADGIEIGLFQPGTHDICRVDGCPAHHCSINDAVDAIKDSCHSLGVRGYDETAGTGELRYIKLEVQRATGKVQLTLVWHAPSEDAAGPRLRNLVEELERRRPSLWYSIWANFHAASKHVSRILAFDQSAWKQLSGRKKALRERLLSCPCPYEHPQLCFPPFVFRQANLCAFEAIVASIRRFVSPRSRVVELYGGVGTIGLHLADLVVSLSCSDENPHNERCFERSVRGLPEDLGSRLSYCTGDAVSQVSCLKQADIVIVDPPRKGLDEPVVATLEKPPSCLQRLIYVSCGFTAFQRDSQRILGAGWSIRHAEGFLLFPGADHLETLCVFDAPAVAQVSEGTAPPAGRRQKKRMNQDGLPSAAPLAASSVTATAARPAKVSRRGGVRARRRKLTVAAKVACGEDAAD